MAKVRACRICNRSRRAESAQRSNDPAAQLLEVIEKGHAEHAVFVGAAEYVFHGHS
jgi:hypothetical protein